MPLTEEQKQKYLASGGNHCPACDSDDIEGTHGIETDSGTAWQHVRCNVCDARWDDIYTLTGVEEVP